jgi:glycosyltransferase involved in cell wall biosynthesis
MTPSLISIIIPAYNAAKTLGKTIQSVLAQTYAEFELLVIDDGSQDDTLAIAQSITDPRIKVFSYPHQGHAASRNRGLDLAQGCYIAFLDADDLWTPDKLAAQYQALQQTPEAAVAYSWTNFIDEDDQFLRRGSYTNANGNVYTKLLLINFIENGSNPLIRQEALLQVGKFDESLVTSPDWDMWLRLAARFAFVCVPAPQVLYRFSPTSVSSNVQGLEQSCVQIFIRHFAMASPEVKALRPLCLGNFYLYLGLKTLEVSQSRFSSLRAVRYLWQAVRYDSTLLRRRRYLLFLALAKLGLHLILSPTVTQEQLKTYKTWRARCSR